MALDLITGHQGVAHISAEQISDINKAMMNGYGDNKVMRMSGGAITQNALTLEIATGYWRANGFDIQIQESETHYIDPSTIGTSRIDNIYVELLQDIPTGAQRAEITIIMGEEAASPVPPEDPTEPYLNTDILLDAVQIGTVTVTEGAMVFTDLTEEYDLVTPSELSAVQALANNALGMIQDDSDAYSSSKTYAVDDLCIHDDVVYKCITACSAAAWSVNQNCFEATTLTSAVTDLNNDFDKANNYSESDVIVGKWINGAPIHKRTVALNRSFNGAQQVTIDMSSWYKNPYNNPTDGIMVIRTEPFWHWDGSLDASIKGCGDGCQMTSQSWVDFNDAYHVDMFLNGRSDVFYVRIGGNAKIYLIAVTFWYYKFDKT